LWRRISLDSLVLGVLLLLFGAVSLLLFGNELRWLPKGGKDALAIAIVLGGYYVGFMLLAFFLSLLSWMLSRTSSFASWARITIFRWRKPLAGFLCAIVVAAFFYIPQSLDNPRSFLAFTRHQIRAGGGGGYYGNVWVDPGYVADVIPRALGVWTYFLALAGLIFCLCKPRLRRTGWLLLAFVLPALLLLERAGASAVRYANPLFPALCVAAGVGISGMLRASKTTWFIKGAIIGVVLVAISGGLVRSWQTLSAYVPEHEPRAQAAIWLVETFDSPEVGRSDRTECIVGRRLSNPVSLLKGITSCYYEGVPDLVLILSRHEGKLRRMGNPSEAAYVRDPDSWWPAAPPSAELVDAMRQVLWSDSYRVKKAFYARSSEVPWWLDMGMSYRPWLCERVTIYERVKASTSD
jgi:hypothetical protein